MNLTIIENTNLNSNAVDARTLHAELGSKQDFSTWLKVKVIESDFFTEEVDYVVYRSSGISKQTGSGGRNRKDYLLTTECAKIITLCDRSICSFDTVKGVLEVLNSSCNYVVKKIRPEFSFGEDIVNNLFSEHIIIPQYPVLNGKYRIDWYIKDMNIAIEFDEDQHFSKKAIVADEVRRKEIEDELGCTFLRYRS